MNASEHDPVTLSALLRDWAKVPATLDRPISGLSCDSRAARSGDLFCALQGLNHHGLEFFDAIRRAQVAAVAWEPPYRLMPTADAVLPSIPISNLRHRLGQLADRFYGDPSRALALIGITGTDGKTSCANYLAQVLHSPTQPCALLGTLGYGLYGRLADSGLTTPDTLTIRHWLSQARRQNARYAVMEVSSHALAQERVADLSFNIAVLTNLGRDHLDYHRTREDYAAVKRKLFQECRPRYAVLNFDDELGWGLAAELADTAVVYSVAKRRPTVAGRYVWAQQIQLNADGIQLTLDSSWGQGELEVPLLGRFNVANLLAVLAVLMVLEMDWNEALRRLARVSTAPGRMERFAGAPGQPLAVVDYAHTPQALEQALQALHEHAGKRLWCVFGCGGDRDSGKRPLMGAVAERWADRLIVTNDNPRGEDPETISEQILAGMRDPGQVLVLLDRGQAIRTALDNAAADDIVLITGKGHEDYQLIGSTRLAFSDRLLVQQWLQEQAA